MKKRTVEVFTAGCPVCDDAVALIRSLACSSCDVIVHDLNQGCATNECRDKARIYGITSLPAVAVDGKLADCCERGGVDAGRLRALGVGEAA